MVVVYVVIAIMSLAVALIFGVDFAHSASNLARAHAGYAHRFPWYYRMTDRWALSQKSDYWRWFGGLFGGVFFVIGVLGMFAELRGTLQREFERIRRALVAPGQISISPSVALDVQRCHQAPGSAGRSTVVLG